ncbi:hypothetical protein RJT34_27799 [Clitoria ternatea]|uniref:Uncharacterized protein n=1 Tax=Clitoria ternatea TaxID=43366 RepID=A0AAN9FDA1_CLITE
MSPLPASIIDADTGDEEVQEIMFARRRCMCCWIHSGTSSSWWEKVRSPGGKEQWWKKLREWSEIVAGPKWKTFIRRFNNHNARAVNYAKQGSFHYDPLSYALNFDDRTAENGAGDDGYGGFSARFASIPTKVSADCAKDASPRLT